MRQRGIALLAKRVFDLAVAGSALAVAAPVAAGCATAIAATMGRPVLFRQPRIGKDERVFHVLKFRTMRPAPEDASPDADHDRITRVGRFLRATSLDELPQLVNVLRGDMSIVGPRPLLVRYLPRYSARQRRRHDVLPGITGWAQIHGRNTLTWEQKFEYDFFYVQHWSPRLDLEILGRTALTVLRREGIGADGHATMPEFLGTESGG